MTAGGYFGRALVVDAGAADVGPQQFVGQRQHV